MKWVPLGLRRGGTWLREHAPLAVLVVLGLAMVLFWLVPAATRTPPRAVRAQEPPAPIGALPIQRDTQVANTLKVQEENNNLRVALQDTNTSLRTVHQAVTRLESDQKARDTAHKTEVDELKKQITVQKTPSTAAKTPKTSPPGPTPDERRLQAENERLRQQTQASQAQHGTDFNRLKIFEVNKDLAHYPTPPSPARADIVYLSAGCQAPIQVVTGASVSGRTDRGKPLLVSIKAPFHCPYQLQGPGRPSLHTEIPLQGCFAFAAAGADMMASRVLGEATLLTCVMSDLAAFERPVKGYLVGSDGNLGIPGVLENHESAAVAKAAFLAFAQETSALIALSRSKYLVTYTGGVGGGAQPGQGLQNGLMELQRYFLDHARRLEPEIRASRGERGYLVIQEGLSLEGLPPTILLTSRRH